MPQNLRKKIMIVDDDDNIRKTFALLLRNKYRILAEKDPADAFQKIQALKVDLVIADVKLPKFSGLELIRKLRDDGYAGEAMLISAHPELLKIEDLGRLRISHFFVKPLDLKILDTSIDKMLEARDEQASNV